jgi:drug/metabolite transporter (DMT)-like permease
LGVVIAIITTLCWSLGIFPFTEAAKRFGSSALNQYRLLLAWVILTIIACAYYKVSPIHLATSPSAHNYFYLGLSGIIGFTIGDFFTFNSFKILGPKLSSLCTTIAPCSALIVGALILKEEINFIGIMGVLTTVGGVIWLTLSKQDAAAAEKGGFERNAKGIVSGIIGALCQGTGLVLSKLGFQANLNGVEIPTFHAVWIRLLFAFSGAMLISIITNTFLSNARIVLRNENKGFKFMLAGTLLGPVAGVSFSLLAISYLKVAEAQTIFALLPIVVLPLNYFFYQEKITLPSILACLTAVSGVFILIWRDHLVRWIWVRYKQLTKKQMLLCKNLKQSDQGTR